MQILFKIYTETSNFFWYYMETLIIEAIVISPKWSEVSLLGIILQEF